jgi:SAM-dependent methyltransferase
MTKRILARAKRVTPLLALIIGLAALSSAAAQTVSEEARQELTIRNTTDRVVIYDIISAVAGGKKTRKALAPNAIDRIPGRADQDIFFRSGDRDLSYRLNAGRPYAFRYDENRNMDIYEASHGRTDVADLAPYLPTPLPVVDRMLAMAQVKRTDVVFDLGCGDGRIVIAAAKKYGARGVGIELDPELIRSAKAQARLDGLERQVSFRLEDATKTDLRQATVVALYLLPESNRILRPRLEEQLRPGALVVSHNYKIPGWEAKEIKLEVVKTEDGEEHKIYLYRR